MLRTSASTDNPVYNGHPWDSNKWAVVQKAVVIGRVFL